MSASPDVVRVLLADHVPVAREANAAALERRPGIDIVGLAAESDEALAMARALEPDVAVLDLHMPGMTGFAVLAQLTADLPKTRVLLLTASEERQTLVDAINAGAAGFLTKPVVRDELADAVIRVSRGETVVSASLTGPLLRGLHGSSG